MFVLKAPLTVLDWTFGIKVSACVDGLNDAVKLDFQSEDFIYDCASTHTVFVNFKNAYLLNMKTDSMYLHP